MSMVRLPTPSTRRAHERGEPFGKYGPMGSPHIICRRCRLIPSTPGHCQDCGGPTVLTLIYNKPKRAKGEF